MNLTFAFYIDATLFATCLWCLWQGSERSLYNPAYWWAGIHFYSVTLRLFSLANGAAPPAFLAISSDTQLLRAAFACDLSLIGVTVATVAVPYLLRDRGPFVRPEEATQLNKTLGAILAWGSIFAGLYSIVKFGGVGVSVLLHGFSSLSGDSSVFQDSASFYILDGVAVQGCVIWFAARGFTRWMVVLMVPLLMFTALTNTRMFVIMPLLLCFLIGQERRKRSRIPVGWLIGFAALGVFWLVAKSVGPAIISEADPQQVLNVAQNELEYKTENSSADSTFLDMQSVYMAAADEAGRRYYGGTILPLLTLPIPRALWPEKPPINAYAVDISTGRYEITRMGLTPNLSGESYINFGWFGAFLIPFLYMSCMQIAFLWSKDDVGFSARWWLYLIFLVSMVQVYRDGLMSVFIFPMLYNCPLFLWGVASHFLDKSRLFQQQAAAQLALEP